ncbi:MAG: hypothetical protein KY457_10505, partial [Actinobacteria bacterium]|nr:hypothetical protein [Actinomycetota bacterium]
MSHLEQARTIVRALRGGVDDAVGALARASAADGRISVSKMDEHQTVAYDLATIASAVAAAQHAVEYGEHGDHEAALALAYAADVHAELLARMTGRWRELGLDGVPAGVATAEVEDAVAAGRDTAFLASIADTVLQNGEAGPRHLPEDLEMVRQTFRRFAEDKVMP